MAATQSRQLIHVRITTEAAEQARQRATDRGITLNDWIARAIHHALDHAKTTGEPQPLRLPWSDLL